MDRRLELAGGQRRQLVGLMMAWLACKCDTRADHEKMKQDLAKASRFQERADGRACLEAMAALDTDQGRQARQVLDLERGPSDHVEEPLTVR